MDFGIDSIEPSLQLGAENTDIGDLYHTYLQDLPVATFYTPYLQEPPTHQCNNKTPPAEWGGEEVAEWGSEGAIGANLDPFSSDLWRLRSLSGSQLLALTPADLRYLVGETYATALLPRLRLLQSSQGSASETFNLQTLPPYYRAESCEPDYYESQVLVPVGTYSHEDLTLMEEEEGGLGGAIGGPLEEIGAVGGLGGGSGATWLGHDLALSSSDLAPSPSSLCDELNDMDLREQFGPIKYEEVELERQEEEEEEDEEEEEEEEEWLADIQRSDMLKKIPSKTRRRERGPKSWEFLMRLLADPRTNPNLVKFEDEAEGTFRLVRPSLVAQLWSSRPGLVRNTSYNNFARGLRHHYNTEALQPVMEKQLVYRCGPRALAYLTELKQRHQS